MSVRRSRAVSSSGSTGTSIPASYPLRIGAGTFITCRPSGVSAALPATFLSNLLAWFNTFAIPGPAESTPRAT